MIDVTAAVFAAVLDALKGAYPREPIGTGFDDSNVLQFVSTSDIPPVPFDFCVVSLSDNSQQSVCIDSTDDKFASITYSVDVYAKNQTDSTSNRMAIQKRARASMATVNDTLNALGFRRIRIFEDSNHDDKGIYRVSAAFSRRIGNHENLI